MLGHPVDAPVLATIVVAVTNQELRAISRKGQVEKSLESSETIRRTRESQTRDDMVRSVWRHTERDRNDRALLGDRQGE